MESKKSRAIVFQNPNNIICFDNKLARSTWIASKEEQKIIYVIISLLKAFEKNSRHFWVSKKMFCQKLNIKPEYGFWLYKRTIENLMNKVNIYSSEKEYEGLAFMTWTKWNEQKDYFEIEINEKIMQLLESLKDKQYTISSLEVFNTLRSKYSMALYRLFSSWNNKIKTTQTHYWSLDYLKKILSVDDFSYLYSNGAFNITAFEKRALKDPIIELSKKMNLSIQYIRQKKNNKEVVYKFSFKKPQNENPMYISNIESKINKSKKLQEQKLIKNIDSFIYEDKNEMKKDIKNIPLTKDINIGIEETIFEKINKDSYFRDLNLQEQEIITHKEILEKILQINELCGNKEKCLYFGCHYKLERDELNNLFLKKYECKKIKDFLNFLNINDEIENK